MSALASLSWAGQALLLLLLLLLLLFLLLLLTLVNMFIGHQSADKSVSPSLTQLGWAGAGLPGGAQPAATAAPPSLQNGAAAAPLPLRLFHDFLQHVHRIFELSKGVFLGIIRC